MRQTTPFLWPVLLTASAVGLLSGCATSSRPAKNDTSTLVLPSARAASSANTAAAPTALRSAPTGTSTSGAAPKSPQAKWSLNERDKTLKVALERWSQTAGWRLLWELGVDYRIGAAATVNGNFEDAVSAVMHNLDQAEVPPKAIFYRGNQVVRVVARGME
jgi:Toxin co-regulated pilus biosynthesis protein Q